MTRHCLAISQKWMAMMSDVLVGWLLDCSTQQHTADFRWAPNGVTKSVALLWFLCATPKKACLYLVSRQQRTMTKFPKMVNRKEISRFLVVARLADVSRGVAGEEVTSAFVCCFNVVCCPLLVCLLERDEEKNYKLVLEFLHRFNYFVLYRCCYCCYRCVCF